MIIGSNNLNYSFHTFTKYILINFTQSNYLLSLTPPLGIHISNTCVAEDRLLSKMIYRSNFIAHQIYSRLGQYNPLSTAAINALMESTRTHPLWSERCTEMNCWGVRARRVLLHDSLGVNPPPRPSYSSPCVVASSYRHQLHHQRRPFPATALNHWLRRNARSVSHRMDQSDLQAPLNDDDAVLHRHSRLFPLRS